MSSFSLFCEKKRNKDCKFELIFKKKFNEKEEDYFYQFS